MQKFETEIDHSIEHFRKSVLLTGDRIRDKVYHFGGFSAAKRDESLFDFWIFNGRFFGIEAKQTAERSLPYKNIKEHQITNLKVVNDLGGVGIFLINFHSTKRTAKGNKIDSTYALNVEDFLSYKENNERSSIPLEYVIEKGLSLDKVQVGFTKPRKEGIEPKPIMGWNLLALKDWVT